MLLEHILIVLRPLFENFKPFFFSFFMKFILFFERYSYFTIGTKTQVSIFNIHKIKYSFTKKLEVYNVVTLYFYY